ncbi:hypothetical protein FSY45_19365 [Comamonas sp. Z1]|uniref:hypothetical protein n=1 Tax=Comamonas sp. Z1 TaxID=2601246 RepID=UPI0011E7C937|nr:hypothetical protein [Comamonas sp. Z1]TYK74325.1 hypothetical protein FSY45_19365 [Comamonas sp. Z1]
MLTPKGQIQREGSVNFGDASISIWEEGIPREWKAAKEWEVLFKRQVFARIVQTLNRLGWTCEIPQDYIKQYGQAFARDYRICHKGDLKGWLETSGRVIRFEMWQDVTPSKNRNGGRYDFDKEKRMPYVIRLEMERTRRRIRDYLCAVFSGYAFETVKRTNNPKPLTITAIDRVTGKRDQDWLEEPDSYHSTSADGHQLQNGMRVYFYDHHGRMGTGIAYCDGGMWDLVTGKWDWARKCNSELYVRCPGDPRIKKNDRLRRQRLEDLMGKAIKAMDFKRAEVLKGILWPAPEPLYLIRKGDAYFRPNYSGYTTDTVHAGKYTAAELKPYASDIERGDLQAILMAAE